jgi:hypothetical protein
MTSLPSPRARLGWTLARLACQDCGVIAITRARSQDAGLMTRSSVLAVASQPASQPARPGDGLCRSDLKAGLDVWLPVVIEVIYLHSIWRQDSSALSRVESGASLNFSYELFISRK